MSPVYETEPWGGVEQGPFLNAMLIADDPALDCHGWLRRGQELEAAADRVREERWGPRTLDVDVVTAMTATREVTSHDDELTLPHPWAHERAFVLIPWLAVDPDATLTVAGSRVPCGLLGDSRLPSATACAAPSWCWADGTHAQT